MEVQLLIQLMENLDLEGLIVLLDFEKAYDRVDQQFLRRILDAMGFSQEFNELLQCIYADAKSKITFNGIQTKSFDCQRGVRQGDPLSCILFLCVMEALSVSLEENHDIEQVQVNGITAPKSKMFADDTALIVKSIRSM